MRFLNNDPIKEAVDRLGENELYDLVTREVMLEQVMPGVWGRAFADAEGNMEKAKALYIKYRVQELKDIMVVYEAADKMARDNMQKSPGRTAQRQRRPLKTDENLRKLSPEEKAEASALIEEIRGLSKSPDTLEDLNDAIDDIAENEIRLTDLKYLRALKTRLEK